MKLGGGGGMKKLIGEDEPDGATLYACVTFSKNKTCYIENVILTGIAPAPPLADANPATPGSTVRRRTSVFST